MTIVVPQGGADRYLMKKYKSQAGGKDKQTVWLSVNPSTMKIVGCQPLQFGRMSRWVSRSGSETLFQLPPGLLWACRCVVFLGKRILNVILVCIFMCTAGCFFVIFHPCQDRVQSEHGRWPKVLAVVAAFLQIRFWPTRYGWPFRHVHIDGTGPHPRVARLRFALPLPLLQTRVGILCKCVLCILEGMTSLSVSLTNLCLQVSDRCQWRCREAERHGAQQSLAGRCLQGTSCFGGRPEGFRETKWSSLKILLVLSDFPFLSSEILQESCRPSPSVLWRDGAGACQPWLFAKASNL